MVYALRDTSRAFRPHRIETLAQTGNARRTVDWVENGNAPDTIQGTKFINDNPLDGVEFKRKHCRYPSRNKYNGTGNGTDEAGWTCVPESLAAGGPRKLGLGA